MSKSCSILNCDRPFYSRTYCTMHYARWLRCGDPMGVKAFRGDPIKWIEQHKNYSGNECLKWPYAIGPDGYGRISVDGKIMNAHRFMCISAHGEPPPDKPVAAIICGNPSCVNPNHLRWTTRKGVFDCKKLYAGETV